MKYMFSVFFVAAVLNNFVLTNFLGICPFLGVSRRKGPALAMSGAVLFVMVIASIFTWLIYHYLLQKYDLEFLMIPSFILVIGSLVQLIEIFMRRFAPRMYDVFGIYLPLITTNCAILGVTLININRAFNFHTALVYSLGAGAGFGLAMIIMAGIREHLEYVDLPRPLQDIPIALLVAGLLSMAFQGFAGTVALLK
ncbi:electron transport complex subunit RsxA [Candidatus Poribacteria bacterium]|nr:MAG: electron transport complex subunit RsxA [Candidatus Poribacteria bacterium]